jgi:hypothetical protein
MKNLVNITFSGFYLLEEKVFSIIYRCEIIFGLNHGSQNPVEVGFLAI